jgi:sporulation protein YlmC with PRC-barrel domain
MKNLLTIMVVVFALAFVPTASYAEWLGGQSQNDKTMAMDKASESMGKSPEYRASTIIGTWVRNYQGEYLGAIRDLMIDPQNGGIAFAIISKGGVLGIPRNFVAVPFGAFTFSAEKKVYLLDMTRERLAAAPNFERGEWQRQVNREWEADVYRYYGQTPSWGESAETMAEGPASAYRFNDLRGSSVRNPQGEKLGTLRDMVVDSQGHVPMAVLAYGGFLGIAAKSVAVPLGDLNFDSAKHTFVLNATKERLDAAPAFKESKVGGSSWTERAYQDYGAYPME